MKQTKLWLTTIVALLCSLTASAHDFEVDGIYYNITSETDLTVAVTFRGTQVSHYANEYLGSVTIPRTVTYDNNAYSVNSIGGHAFCDCDSLTSITITEGVTGIGYNAFEGCSSLTSITIPESVISIGSSAFNRCSSLTSITIPESVISIGSSAFNRCSSLTSITIPEGVTSIGSGAFSGCGSLTSINIPEGVTSIGSGAFSGCGSLTSINIPESVTNIGERAFYGCTNLISVTIPQSLTSLGKNAFYGCSKLSSSITIPQGVTSIKEGVFYDCSSLTSVFLPKNLTAIERLAFSGCSSLTSMSIPESVTSIGRFAFSGCIRLVSVNIPKGVTCIESWTFHECSSLTSIVIPDKVTSIEDEAFWKCTSLTSITIPENVVSVGNGAFALCNGLKHVTLNCPEIGSWFTNNTSIKEIVLGENVISIGANAFAGCSSLSSINIPKKVTSIGDSAFSNCRNLTAISIPENVSVIGSYAFNGCSSLGSITIPKGVDMIKYGTFSGCRSLTSITIPKKVKEIGNGAFYGCTSLKEFVVEEGSSTLELGDYESNYYDPNYKEKGLLYDCPLETVYIGRNLSYYALSPFDGPNELTTLVLGDSVTKVKSFLFTGCSNLVELTIGRSVSSIGRKAFNGGVNLQCIYALNENVIECEEDAFPVEAYSKAILHVPTDGIYAYMQKSPWNKFHVEPMRKFTATYIVDDEVYETVEVEYAAKIKNPKNPTRDGYTFMGWKGGPKTMPANDVTIYGTFAINKYLVTFKIGDDVIASDSLEYGVSIVVPEVPEKEGYTFDGWKNVFQTVPAKDVVVEGTYTANEYLLAFIVDGALYEMRKVKYDEEIAALDLVEKVGYAFVWENWIGRMPAKDYTIRGKYVPNEYVLNYVIDGEVVQSDSIVYGTAITLLDDPTKEGYTFSGWSEAPETMPAEDLTISGTFTVNTYKVYYYVGEELVHTAEVAYGEAIPEYTHEPTGEGDVFEGWVGETYATMPAHDVTYVANITNGIEQSAISNHKSEMIYDLMGRKVTDTENLKGGVYIINGRKVVINVNDERLTKTTVIIR